VPAGAIDVKSLPVREPVVPIPGSGRGYPGGRCAESRDHDFVILALLP